MTDDLLLEIKLLRNQLELTRNSLQARDQVAADLRRQNQWLRERLQECQDSSSSSPD
jgi:hypothetical protein